MTLFKHARGFARTFWNYGPLGLYFTAKAVWLEHRVRRLQTCIDREKDLHRSMVRNLNTELNMALGQQHSIRVAAAHLIRHCQRQDAERAKPVAGV